MEKMGRSRLEKLKTIKIGDKGKSKDEDIAYVRKKWNLE